MRQCVRGLFGRCVLLGVGLGFSKLTVCERDKVLFPGSNACERMEALRITSKHTPPDGFADSALLQNRMVSEHQFINIPILSHQPAFPQV